MKAVLISIKPRWAEKIANGKKTVEVRKTKPKIYVPFKCYIYCTEKDYDKIFCIDKFMHKVFLDGKGKQKVIGEFVCKRIDRIGKRGGNNNFDYCYLPLVWGNDDIEIEITDIRKSCIAIDDLNSYGASSACLYAWHISDLIIYDEPKELSEFYVDGDCDCMNCKNCAWFDRGNGYNVEDDCNLAYKGADEHKSYKPIKRPFQSWGYVYEVDT